MNRINLVTILAIVLHTTLYACSVGTTGTGNVQVQENGPCPSSDIGKQACTDGKLLTCTAMGVYMPTIECNAMGVCEDVTCKE